MLPTPGFDVGPQSPGGTDLLLRDTCNRPIGRRVLCWLPAPSFPSSSFANPCSVLQELPQRLATGLSLPLAFCDPVVASARELTGLLNRSRGIGLDPRLSKGLGRGLAALVPGAVFGLSKPLSSLLSPTSLSPDISLRLRGRKEADEAGVELVRTSLACIAGDV